MKVDPEGEKAAFEAIRQVLTLDSIASEDEGTYIQALSKR